jgi:hypothetical protein
MEKFTPQPPDQEPEQVPSVSDEKDLVPDQEVRNLLVQYTPAALKDIALIEQGVENFYRFHDSPEALTHPDRLQFLGAKDLRWLDSKNAIRLYQYVRTSADAGKLEVQTVAFRPADLHGTRISRIKRACIRESAYSILRHLAYRERILNQLEERGELGMWLRKRLLGDMAALPMRKTNDAVLKKLPEFFQRLSFEHFLESEMEISSEMRNQILELLRAAPSAEGSLEKDVEPPDEVRRVIQARGGRPALLMLSPGCHAVFPVLTAETTDLPKGESWTMLRNFTPRQRARF